MFSRVFLLDAIERAIKTIAQTALAVLTVSATPLLDVDWAGVGLTALGAGLVSVLTSVVSASAGVSGTASLTTVVEPVGRHSTDRPR